MVARKMLDVRGTDRNPRMQALKSLLTSEFGRAEPPECIVDVCCGDTSLLRELEQILQSEWRWRNKSMPRLIGVNPAPKDAADIERHAVNALIIQGICDNGSDLWARMEELGIADPENTLCIYSPASWHAREAGNSPRFVEASNAAQRLLFD